MAKCTRCQKEWKWDFGQDVYRGLDGKTVRIVELDDVDMATIHTAQGEMSICDCGKILSFSVLDDDGQFLYNLPDWKDVNWEAEEHCAPYRR